ncbi:MAG: hypothetical protein A3F14_00500 [Gammaproteobacteria bacterium RIFCSPHIGHO2_12_FULL_43_28]|nr:MAG: hypothetical protein A3F14_00500 [Gammaproteobacteria bacterium RIFCSPHIGHO2_12_FULL_43_28]
MVAFVNVFFIVVLFFASSITYAKSYSEELCQSNEYICYVVKRGDTWKKLFPDPDAREVVKRINRMNVPLYRGKTIAIPANDLNNIMSHSPFPQQIDPTGQRFIKVSVSKLAFGAYDADGTLLHWGPISGGKNYCADVRRGCRTPTGKFAIYRKQGADCKSTKFPVGKGGAPMPYCMFFKGGFAMHGSPTVPGYNDSHGCIRLFTSDAEWLNSEFTNGYASVPVLVEK